MPRGFTDEESDYIKTKAKIVNALLQRDFHVAVVGPTCSYKTVIIERATRTLDTYQAERVIEVSDDYINEIPDHYTCVLTKRTPKK